MDKRWFLTKKIIIIFLFLTITEISGASSNDAQKAWLGISVKPIDNGDIKLSISEVEPNSPAEKVGLKNDDLLKSINGKNLTNLNLVKK